jgi:UNC-50 family
LLCVAQHAVASVDTFAVERWLRLWRQSTCTPPCAVIFSRGSVAAAASAAAALRRLSPPPLLRCRPLPPVGAQLDMESACEQMVTLLSLHPARVYKTAYYRKQTKNQWARDDPAFALLQAAFSAAAAVAYGMAFGLRAFWG